MSGGHIGAFRAIAGASVGCIVAASMIAAGDYGCGGDAFTAGSPAAVEAGANETGAREASAPPVDAGEGWCALHGAGHTFCEDFLHGVPDQLVEIALNGSIAPDAVDFESAPQSMAASAPSLAKGGAPTAFASHDLSKMPGSQFTVSSFFKVATSCFPSAATPSPISILALNFAPESNYEFVVSVLPTSISLVEVTSDADGGNAKGQQQSVQATGLLGAWQEWTLVIDGSALGKSATLTVGNAVLFNKVSLKSAPLAALQHPSVYLGLAAKNDGTDPTPVCKVGLDDILIDVHPSAVVNEGTTRTNATERALVETR